MRQEIKRKKKLFVRGAKKREREKEIILISSEPTEGKARKRKKIVDLLEAIQRNLFAVKVTELKQKHRDRETEREHNH